MTVERDWFWFWFWFYYALWLASVFTLVLVLRQSSENRSISFFGYCSYLPIYFYLFHTQGTRCDTNMNSSTRLRAVSYFSLESYCKRKSSRRVAKPRATINKGISPRRKNKRLLTPLFCLGTTTLSR